MNVSSQLRPDAPAELSILPESSWSDYDRRIWDGFDEMIDQVLQGNTPYPEKESIGRFKGLPALIARFHTDNLTDELEYPDSIGAFGRLLMVSTSVFTYPETQDSLAGTYFTEVPISEEPILEEDGEYDVLTQVIPSDFLDYVTQEIFPDDWADRFDESEGNVLLEFIEHAVGPVDAVADPTVRDHLKKLIKAHPSTCPED